MSQGPTLVRIIIPTSYDGSHMTLRCEETTTFGTLKKQALDKIIKRSQSNIQLKMKDFQLISSGKGGIKHNEKFSDDQVVRAKFKGRKFSGQLNLELVELNDSSASVGIVKANEDYKKMDKHQLIQLLNEAKERENEAKEREYKLKEQISVAESGVFKKLYQKALVINRLREDYDSLDEKLKQAYGQMDEARNELQAEKVSSSLYQQENEDVIARLTTTIQELAGYLKKKEEECEKLQKTKTSPDNNGVTLAQLKIDAEAKATEKLNGEMNRTLNQWADITVHCENLEEENKMLRREIEKMRSADRTTPSSIDGHSPHAQAQRNQEREILECIEKKYERQPHPVWRRGSHIRIIHPK